MDDNQIFSKNIDFRIRTLAASLCAKQKAYGELGYIRSHS